MAIDNGKRPRSVLKTYFATNAIPTEAQFADLIDGGLNQRDDGIYKAAGDPLSIEAAGEEGGQKRAVAFYASFADKDPAWSIALNARRVAADPATARAGWTLLGADGTPRLTVDAATGNLGIGTLVPVEKLDVDGRVRAGTVVAGTWPHNADYAFIGTAALDHAAPENYALLQHARGTTFVNATDALHLRIGNDDRMVVSDTRIDLTRPLGVAGATIGAWPAGPGYFHLGAEALDQHNGANYALLVGIAAEPGATYLNSPTHVNLRVGNADRVIIEQAGVTVTAPLRVTGPLTPSAGNGAGAGIAFPNDPGGGGGDTAWIRYYPRVDEHCTLDIGTANDELDHIALMPGMRDGRSLANVGIATLDPREKLHVAGAVRADTMTMGPWPYDARGAFVGASTLDQVDQRNYALLQGQDGPWRGQTFLNSPVQVSVRIANGDQMVVGPDGVVIARALTVGGPVDAGGPINIRGRLAVGEAIVVAGPADLRGDVAVQRSLSVAGPVKVAAEIAVGGDLTARAIVARAAVDVTGPIVARATVDATGQITARDLIVASVGRENNRGILFPGLVGDGGGDRAYIRYYARNNVEAGTLLIGIENDGDDHIALMPSGNVGIGTENPAAKLHVNGNGSFNGDLNVSGEVRSAKGPIWMSSIALKRNIRPLPSERAASILAGLDPVSFEWKAEGEGAPEQLGFIAQHSPADVTTPERDAIALPPIVAALTRVVRDQGAAIAALQERLDRLEALA